MSFGSQLREFRDEYLHITQKQMAQDLGVNPGTISRYESDEREFPIEQLQVMKELYNIPDDMFLAIILDRPLKSVRPSTGLRTLDSTSYYSNGWNEPADAEYRLREIIAVTDQMTPDNRALFFAGLQNFVQLFKNQLRN
ncbi:helix-turn-helix transcriptional regulator [Sporosarcina sp. GW1-11]|uniref:helix-turn-helix domain-containing protein n=1 Tax=Sporosarcina sp. GW1-11 TaxID=2899126 RepID=UPI00294C8901|nr:helix-turn-helix transcriptional regulator [Sporosarcina sp. GW1-11]MDV6378241.1 helix-turn-helix transcriptional regulator [Sporosarcina sp. GW1-11]